MPDKEKFVRSCQASEVYPNNLLYQDTYDHILADHIERLDAQESRIFCEESKSGLDIRDYDGSIKCFEDIRNHNYADLQEYFSGKPSAYREDPQCRFVFVHAPHSRERLRVTRRMLLFVLTYHQVFPAFLDFLYPFGKQRYAQDFQFSAFHHDDRLSLNERGLCIQELGRSGRDIRVCYNLKSVEPSKSQPQWPWSVRQTAAYHSFDVETGKAVWIIIKGDQLMKRRMAAATKSSNSHSSFQTPGTCFSSSLATHLVLFEWSREKWRWYINFLEQELQVSTRQTLLVDIDNDSKSMTNNPPPAVPSHYHRSATFNSEKASVRSPSITKKSPPRRPPPPSSNFPSQMDDSDSSDDDDGDGESFSFNDLQRVQFLEEQASEIALVLESNINIVSEIKQHYTDIVAFDDWPGVLKENCSKDVAKFQKTTSGVISDLRMQLSRTQMLLRLLTERKSLLYGILDYRNMESNKSFASRAQLSTENMESMTQDMHELAQKTKQETVSMRIITLVTLFFLPGTFISTIMSTDIIQFQVSETGKSQEIFQLGALQIYLAITVPMMVITFASWYGVYFWVDRKEKVKVNQKRLKAVV
ncbi:hypothetical protein LSUE1_G005916 [Lachnellula suecica]|uniref:CorA-like transporter domain-containing protein n=1 Tax=Lachnellula suecica TaxID=602035 RepID=A0A8T9CGG2_9HELO|nr:hypothetical protein LSUE1_G005916 [Lachnellula suecica]